MHLCPKCGSSALRQSRARGFEGMRSLLTKRRPHRCSSCQWRGWITIGETAQAPGISLREYTVEPDLSEIDDQLAKPISLR